MPAEALDILIVSFRRPDLLRRCLDSVERHMPGANVWIWDNHSDASPEIMLLAASFPHCFWHFSAVNVGFGAGVNALASMSSNDILLLNPDAELSSDLSLTRAVLVASRVAAAAPLCVDPAQRRPWDNAHRPVGPVRSLVSYAGFAQRLRSTPLSELYPRPPGTGVGYLTGACLLISRQAWEDVGPFDRRFFLYCEELDWALRARKRGWSLRLSGEFGYAHSAMGTVRDDPGKSGTSLRLLRQSQHLYIEKHWPRLGRRIYEIGISLSRWTQRTHRRAAPR